MRYYIKLNHLHILNIYKIYIVNLGMIFIVVYFRQPFYTLLVLLIYCVSIYRLAKLSVNS